MCISCCLRVDSDLLGEGFLAGSVVGECECDIDFLALSYLVGGNFKNRFVVSLKEQRSISSGKPMQNRTFDTFGSAGCGSSNAWNDIGVSSKLFATSVTNNYRCGDGTVLAESVSDESGHVA